MRVIALRTLRIFWGAHADAEQSLKSWYDEAKKAKWKTPNDIKAEYSSASFIPGDRVVFNIRGNTYRLVVAVNYARQKLFIRFIGTHSMYDKINAEKI